MSALAFNERTRAREFNVLLTVVVGLIAILMTIILGLFLTPRALPNWAENVLVSIASVAGLKLGDCLSALVQLASGRQVAQLGEKLANSAPAELPAPETAQQAAAQVAGAAEDEAARIKGASD